MAYTESKPYATRGYYKIGGDWTFPDARQSSNVQMKSTTDSRSGTSNPKWREIIRFGGNATTAYQRSTWRLTAQRHCDVSVDFLYPRYPSDPSRKVVCEAYCTGDGPWAFTGVFPLMSGTPSSSNYAQARNLALKHLYNRYADLNNAFQGGVFAGELRETWHMIKDPLSGLKRGLWGYLDDIQHRLARDRGIIGRLPKKRRTKWINDAIADSWLSATLGWMPLCNDIDSAFKALTNMHDRSETFGLTATGEAESLDYSSTNSAMVNNYIYTIVNERRKSKSSVRIKAGFRFTPQQIDERMSLAGQLSLTMADFIPTIWNLLPGSFLTDYVTNIGDILDAVAHPLAGMSYIVESHRYETTGEYEVLLDIPRIKSVLGTSFVAAGGDPGGATAVARGFSRSIPSSTMPTFEFSLNLTDRQLLNVAALLQKGNFVRLASLGLIK